MNDYEALRRVIPTLVTFTRREDQLIVDTNGDGILTWTFHLVADLGRDISELTFPVYVEIPLKQIVDRAITVEAVEVNGESRDPTGMYREVEKRYPDNRLPDDPEMIQYAQVTIPVPLRRGQAECQIRVRLRLWNTFPHLKTAEALFVDIPYVTEQLRVEISAEQHLVRIPYHEPEEPTSAVRAASSLMQTFDSDESLLQSRLCKEREGRLVWITNSAKLGYHYRVYFRLSEP
jgi:hypothetical protein